MFEFLSRIFSGLKWIINWKSYKYPTLNEKQEIAKSRIKKYALIPTIRLAPIDKYKKNSIIRSIDNSRQNKESAIDAKQSQIAKDWMAL